MKNNDIYLSFPVSFIREIFHDKKQALNDIIKYAIYNHYLKLDYGDIEQRFTDAGNFFGIVFTNANYDVYLSRCEDIQRQHTSNIKVSIKKEMLFDYRDNDKTDKQIASLCAFLAIKSILGNKKYVRTNKGLILGRLFGLDKRIEIDRYGKDAILLTKPEAVELYNDLTDSGIGVNSLNGAIKKGLLVESEDKKVRQSDVIKWIKVETEYPIKELKYITRRGIDNLLRGLEDNWNLVIIPEGRSVLLSLSLGLDALAEISVKAKYKEKIRVNDKLDAINKAKNKLRIK